MNSETIKCDSCGRHAVKELGFCRCGAMLCRECIPVHITYPHCAMYDGYPTLGRSVYENAE
jgi:hypothetical protein